MNSLSRTPGNRQRGVAMVEFTLVLPLLLFLMLGTAELGRAFFQHNTLTKAVRDGGRYLSANALSGTGAIVNTVALGEAANLVVCGKTACAGGDSLLPGLSTADVSATVSADSTHVTVTTSYAYQPIIGAVLPSFGLGGGDISLMFTLRSTVIMRVL